MPDRDKNAAARTVILARGVLSCSGAIFWRSSSGGSKEKKAAPEGLIDPYVRLLSFWDGDRPLASLTYYACHPCALYGHGGVSSEIMGLARAARQAELPEAAHVHFNGAGGDIALGKYNDNTLATRARLAERLAAGMKIAWQTQEKTPLTAADVSWRVRPVLLPVKKSYSEAKLLRQLETMKGPTKPRMHAARRLAWLRRLEADCHTDLGCLRIGPARVLHMPGELFVAYQLAAQKMRPDKFVCMVANGEDGMTYIGTKSDYPKGGYEVGMSRVAPEVEDVLMPAMRELLDR